MKDQIWIHIFVFKNLSVKVDDKEDYAWIYVIS